MSKLKIKVHHYSYILSCMRSKMDELGVRKLVEYSSVLRILATKDVQKRLRWDLFHASIANRPDLYKDLYEYMNDTHIDTALRKIMEDLGISTI